MNLYNAVWIFFIYAFAGWCTEVVFMAVTTGEFINRGFLHGPVCPIYGFGVLIVVWTLDGVKENLPLLFICSVLLTSALEFAAGFTMEKLFSQRWWDYSDVPLNIGGYVCLKFSLVWGMACVLVVDVVHPLIMSALGILPHFAGWITAGIFTAIIIADVTLAAVKATKLRHDMRLLSDIGNALTEVGNSIGGVMAGSAIKATEAGTRAQEELSRRRDELAARRADTIEKMLSTQRRLLRAFPDMKPRSPLSREALGEIRERLKRK